MQEAKKTGKPYFQTDSHCNHYGAYLGYLEIMEKVQETFPNVSIITPDQITFSFNSRYGQDLSGLLNASKFTIEKNAVEILTKAAFQLFLNSTHKCNTTK